MNAFNLIRNQSLRRIVTMCIAIILSPSASIATKYECSTEQAMKWDHGGLVPNAHLQHGVYRFDDETEVLWEAVDSSLPFGPSQLKLSQKASSGNDLIATSEHKLGANIIGETVLYIRTWDKKSHGIIFMLLEPIGNISTGHCAIVSGTK